VSLAAPANVSPLRRRVNVNHIVKINLLEFLEQYGSAVSGVVMGVLCLNKCALIPRRPTLRSDMSYLVDRGDAA